MAPEDEGEFTYPALVNRWRRERSTAALTKMDGRFYEAFDKHLKELREEYQREHAVNPANPKVLILQDELMNLQRVRDDLYDLRERKLVTSAIISARGGKPDRANLTKEEDLLYDEVLRVLRDARRNLLRRGAPKDKDIPKPAGGPPVALDPVADDPTAHVAQPAASQDERLATPEPEQKLPGAPPVAARVAPAPEAVTAEDEPERRSLGPARVIVRMKEDVPPFVASDMRQYHLSAEDIVAVPKEIAHALVQRGAAIALSA